MVAVLPQCQSAASTAIFNFSLSESLRPASTSSTSSSTQNLHLCFGCGIVEGDTITACLDLDACMVAFRKNGETVGTEKAIERDEYYFYLMRVRKATPWPSST